MDEHSLDGKRAVVASKFLPLLICVSQTIILSTRSPRNLLINTIGCFTLPFHSTEIGFSQIQILTIVFSFGQQQLVAAMLLMPCATTRKH